MADDIRLPRKTLNRAVGLVGEDAAVRELARRNYRILARNHRNPAGEIDVIAADGDTIVFVEVKTRSPRSRLSPASAVDAEKQRRITAAAKYYLSQFREKIVVRYDIVSVLLDDADHVAAIEHTPDAFRP